MTIDQYLCSLISSLINRFSAENTPQYQLFNLQPASMAHLERNEFKKNVAVIRQNYNIDYFRLDGINWYDFWCTRH